MRAPIPTSLRQAAPALALVLLMCSLTSCSRSTSVSCSPELACPAGWFCSGDGKSCIQTLCGDTIVQVGEACDDGNTQGGDGCNSSCTSTEECGNGYVDENEQCDDKNDDNTDDCLKTCELARCGDGYLDQQGLVTEECDYGDRSTPCNLDCTTPRCGDGLVTASTGEECDNGMQEDTKTCDWNCKVPTCGDGYTNRAAGEECDDSNTNDGDDCLSTCKRNSCGDGYRDSEGPGVEACDDGNTLTEETCPYGGQSCWVCKADCSAQIKRTGAYCGDGIRNGDEVCDDGNTREETECTRGDWSCRSCSADCSRELVLSGTVCGDLNVAWWETCDDGNAESCGSCNASCTDWVESKKATGRMTTTAPGNLSDGETFTLYDGQHAPVVFEFDRTGSTAPGRVLINLNSATRAEDVANLIAEAINGQPGSSLTITATATGSKVSLVNRKSGGVGNQALLETVSHADFRVTAMSGGQPYGCAEGVGCDEDEDCAQGLECVNNLCTAP